MKSIAVIIIALICSLLSACISSVPIKPLSGEQINQASWKEGGVIGYRDANQAFTASYVWKKIPQAYQINVLGPLGAWRATIDGNAHFVSLKLSDGRKFQAKNAEQLMQQHLGWAIPVQDLTYWLAGLPAPYESKKVRYEDGFLKELQQNHWTIHFLDYHHFGVYQIPSRLILQQDAIKITLVVDEFSWEREL